VGTRPIFSRLWNEVHKIEVCMCGSVRGLQRCFPIEDFLLRSGDIRDQQQTTNNVETGSGRTGLYAPKN